MAYRIEYDSRGGKYEIKKDKPSRLPVLAAAAFLLFLLFTFQFWDAGAEVIRDLLIPGDREVTVRAWDHMTDDLRSGAGLQDAFAAFCAEVLDGAGIPD